MQRQLCQARRWRWWSSTSWTAWCWRCSDLHAIVRQRREGRAAAAAGGRRTALAAVRIGRVEAGGDRHNDMLRAFGKALHAHSRPLSFTLVVRPPHPRSPYFGAADYQAVTGTDVDYLQPHDVRLLERSASTPGPNAPLPWARQSAARAGGRGGQRGGAGQGAAGRQPVRHEVEARVRRGGEAVLGRDYVADWWRQAE